MLSLRTFFPANVAPSDAMLSGTAERHWSQTRDGDVLHTVVFPQLFTHVVQHYDWKQQVGVFNTELNFFCLLCCVFFPFCKVTCTLGLGDYTRFFRHCTEYFRPQYKIQIQWPDRRDHYIRRDFSSLLTKYNWVRARVGRSEAGGTFPHYISISVPPLQC